MPNDDRSGQPARHASRKRSETFGAAFGTAWTIAIVFRLLQWVTDADREATPWQIQRVVVLAALAVSGAGWIYWRFEEREPQADGIVDAARTWLTPVLLVAALLGVLFVASDLG